MYFPNLSKSCDITTSLLFIPFYGSPLIKFEELYHFSIRGVSVRPSISDGVFHHQLPSKGPKFHCMVCFPEPSPGTNCMRSGSLGTVLSVDKHNLERLQSRIAQEPGWAELNCDTFTTKASADLTGGSGEGGSSKWFHPEAIGLGLYKGRRCDFGGGGCLQLGAIQGEAHPLRAVSTLWSSRESQSTPYNDCFLYLLRANICTLYCLLLHNKLPQNLA